MKIISLLLLAATGIHAAPIVLYDGALGTLPGAQGWLFASLPPGATQTVQNGATTLDTSGANAFSAGYSIAPPFAIDLATEVRMRFDVRVNSEMHVSTDRAGFSVILLGSTMFGIELAFWADQIWAQNTNFTHGEGVAIDTTAGLIRYDLFLNALGYRLLAGGNLILSGNLRNYSGQSASPLAAVYSIPNFLFLGDDTTSASASIDFAYADIEQVPERGTWLVGALLLAGVARRKA